MNWLDRIPRVSRGPISVALVLAGGLYTIGWRDPWGLVVVWAGITLAFASYLVDELRRDRSDGEPRTPPDLPIL